MMSLKKNKCVFDERAQINRRRNNIRMRIEQLARLSVGELTNEYGDELAEMWNEYDFLHSIELNQQSIRR